MDVPLKITVDSIQLAPRFKQAYSSKIFFGPIFKQVWKSYLESLIKILIYGLGKDYWRFLMVLPVVSKSVWTKIFTISD